MKGLLSTADGDPIDVFSVTNHADLDGFDIAVDAVNDSLVAATYSPHTVKGARERFPALFRICLEPFNGLLKPSSNGTIQPQPVAGRFFQEFNSKKQSGFEVFPGNPLLGGFLETVLGNFGKEVVFQGRL